MGKGGKPWWFCWSLNLKLWKWSNWWGAGLKEQVLQIETFPLNIPRLQREILPIVSALQLINSKRCIQLLCKLSLQEVLQCHKRNGGVWGKEINGFEFLVFLLLNVQYFTDLKVLLGWRNCYTLKILLKELLWESLTVTKIGDGISQDVFFCVSVRTSSW